MLADPDSYDFKKHSNILSIYYIPVLLWANPNVRALKDKLQYRLIVEGMKVTTKNTTNQIITNNSQPKIVLDVQKMLINNFNFLSSSNSNNIVVIITLPRHILNDIIPV